MHGLYLTSDMQKYVIKKAQEGDEEAKLFTFTYSSKNKSEDEFFTMLKEFETEMRCKLHEFSMQLAVDAYNLGWLDGRKEDDS